jgi:DNA-binding MarR family transcriptional regulator
MAIHNQQEYEESIMPWLGKTGKMMFLFMANKLKQHGLNMSMEQAIILKILHHEDGQTQNDMAHVTNRHKATLTRLLDTMEKNHLVVRIPDPNDKRVKRIYLTKHGRQYYEAMTPAFKEASQELQMGLTQTEISTLISILKKVQSNIKVQSSMEYCENEK